jgi:thioredoxin reductase
MIGALDPSTVTVATRTSALALRSGPEIEILGPETGHRVLRPRAVVLATGIRERPRSARLVPGRRPERGVLTTGQLQQMVARGVAVGGRRAVVVGTEHVAFSVLLTARHAGLEVVAMVGAEDRILSYPAAGWIARALGIPIHLASHIEDIEGTARVEAVSVHGPAGLRRIECDTLVFTGDFVPDAALLSTDDIDPDTGGPLVDQHGRTNLPGVFAAGNVLRAVESSGWAAVEGARVGANAAAFLRRPTAWRGAATRIVAGAGVGYIVPQFRSPDEAVAPLPVSLRADADAAHGRLRLAEGGIERWSRTRGTVLRMRRIAMDPAAFGALKGDHGQRATIEID